MEIKTVKQSVKIKKDIFSQSAEVPFDLDLTMPDYCPDIMKILKCNVIPMISSKSVNGSVLTVDGHITVNVLYCNDENGIYNYEQISPFSKTFESGMDLSGAMIKGEVCTEYLNCRAVSGKRLDIHGALTVTVGAWQNQSCDIITDAQDDKVQLDKQNMTSVNTVGFGEKSLILEEMIEISQSQKPVDCILRYNCETEITECKIIKNKVAAKGELKLNILYCSAGHKNYCTYKANIPFSQFIDIDGISEECSCRCKATLSFLELKPVSGEDDNRKILLNAKIIVKAEAICECMITVINDAYSVCNKVELDTNEAVIENRSDTITDTYMFKNKFDLPTENIESIVDINCIACADNCNISKGMVIVKPKLNVSILSVDSDQKPVYCDKVFEFDYTCVNEKAKMCNSVCDAEFKINSVSYTLLSGSSIEIRVDFKVCINVRGVNKVSLLNKLDVGEPLQTEQNCSLVIYYAEKGERIWDIAKKYCSKIDELCKINNINDNTIPDKCALLVPLY